MAGRHSKRGTRTQVPEQRRPRAEGVTDAVGITDARTRVEHLMTEASAREHRQAGRYPTLCGIEVVAASLTERERGQCRPCREQATLTAPAARPARPRWGCGW